MNTSRLPPEEIERIYQKAMAAGLVAQDPVGAWLANICSIWALLFELTVISSIRFPATVIAAVILFLFLIQACRKLGAYNGTSIFMPLLMALIMGPFSAPSAILVMLGGLKAMK